MHDRSSSLVLLLGIAGLLAAGAAARAQTQFETLAAGGLPIVGAQTEDIVHADVDGDGDLDVLAGGVNMGSNIHLFRNDGGGRFTDVTSTQLPAHSSATYSIACGDVDRDGDLDVILGNYHQSCQYRNDGTGRFTDVTATQMPVEYGRRVRVARLGDVDRDGDLDLFMGTGVSPSLLYLNDGTGRFTGTTGRLPSVFFDPEDAALADLDADGDLDIIAAGPYQERLCRNDGSGTFTDITATHLPPVNDNSHALAVGDVDGDRDLDLVIVNSDQDRLLLNDGSGRFVEATASHMPVDTNNIDRSVALGDVDGDGDPDLVIGTTPLALVGAHRLYLNDGSGRFTDGTTGRMPPVGETARAAALGDLDRDGDLDLLLGHGTEFGPQQNRVYWNNGRGTFFEANAERLPPLLANGTAVAMGDIDADGHVDLVVGKSGANNVVCRSDGRDRYTAALLTQTADLREGVRSLAFGDVDRDGDLDLVVGTSWWFRGDIYLGANKRVHVNDGAGRFTDESAARMPPAASGTNAIALLDADGDGDLDCFCGNDRNPLSGQGGGNALYRNDGTGRFTDVTVTHLPADADDTNGVACGDVDGDGDLDLVTGNSDGSRLYLNDGTAVFRDVTAARMPAITAHVLSVSLGDVDGDGDLDLVSGVNGQNRLYRNDGTGTFQDVTAGRLPVASDFTTATRLVDADGDGWLDLLLAKGALGERYLRNDGTGSFVDVSAVRLPSADGVHTFTLGIGDVDGDGDDDLLAVKNGAPRLYLNLLRQIDTPYVLRSGQTFDLDLYARYGPPRPADLALPIFSTRTANVALPPFGRLGLDPAQAILLPSLTIAQPPGKVTLSFRVPVDSRIDGLNVYWQALVGQPAQAWLTGVVADTGTR